MALSSDEIIKREIMETFGASIGDLRLRIFPESSNDDQVLFTEGGLTFSKDGVDYGSCDAGWFIRKNGENIPFIGLEGTDALNRKSSGNAQYQRFHHALGAVKNGLIGVYYLKKGIDKIQDDLFGMAVSASKHEAGTYLIIDDLEDLRPILENYHNPTELDKQLQIILKRMETKFLSKFNAQYGGSWKKFAKKRSAIIQKNRIVKYAGRMKRNFTDGSQRAGHIAVGEMYLTKYFFYGRKVNYLMLKMTREEVIYLDEHKANDKEWYLLRHEPDVEIKTMDDIFGLDNSIKDKLLSIKDEPIKGEAFQIYKKCVDNIDKGLKNGSLIIM
ncbi:MAG: hypothetical protein LBS50_03225 [Prevotellaceae bacterium]|jgi:hypothetical protein|nr:hypothetical protein [Prevotellaceae bacterium]